MPTTTNGLESEVPSPSSSSGSGSFTGFDLALVFAVLAVAVFLGVGDLEAAEITIYRRDFEDQEDTTTCDICSYACIRLQTIPFLMTSFFFNARP